MIYLSRTLICLNDIPYFNTPFEPQENSGKEFHPATPSCYQYHAQYGECHNKIRFYEVVQRPASVNQPDQRNSPVFPATNQPTLVFILNQGQHISLNNPHNQENRGTDQQQPEQLIKRIVVNHLKHRTHEISFNSLNHRSIYGRLITFSA